MDPSDEEVKARPEEFSSKPMNSCEFGTRRREFGALHRTTEFLRIWRQALSCGGGGPYLTFLLCHANPSNHTSSHSPPQILVSGMKIFSICLLLPDSQEFHSFSSWENQIDFLPRHRFLCVDLWPKPAMFYTSGQTCVLPKADLCFANVEASVLLDSI